MLASTIQSEILVKSAAISPQSARLLKLILGGTGLVGGAGGASLGYKYYNDNNDNNDNKYVPAGMDRIKTEKEYLDNYEATAKAVEDANRKIGEQNRHISKLEPGLKEEYYRDNGVYDEIDKLGKLRARWNNYKTVMQRNGMTPDVNTWMKANNTDVDPTKPALSVDAIVDRLHLQPFKSRQIPLINQPGTLADIGSMQQNATTGAITLSPDKVKAGEDAITKSIAPNPAGASPTTTADLLPYLGAIGGAGIGAFTGGDEYDEYGRKKEKSTLGRALLGGGLGLGAGYLAKQYLK